VLALRGGQNPVAIDVHLVKMREEGGFELLPRGCLDAGKSVLQKPQRVPADAWRDITAGRGAQQEQFAAEKLGLPARDIAIVVEIEPFEQLVGAIAGLGAGEVSLLQGLQRLGNGLGRRDRCAERTGNDEHFHRKLTAPELRPALDCAVAENLSPQTLHH
jgi:hypothetical protein